MTRKSPYAKGVDAGAAYRAAFQVWSALARVSHDYSGKPTPPVNPYAPGGGKRGGAYQWQAGFNVGNR